MNREEFFYLLPYLFSLALSLGVFLYAWRHRQVRGVRAYTWFVGGQVLTISGFILELISADLQTKILWDKFQWVAESALIFIPFLLFAIQFSEHKLKYPRLVWGYWISVPVLFILLLLTDSLHHLLYPNPTLSVDRPFPELQYDFTFVVYAYSFIYIYAANFYGIGVLVKRALQPYNIYRSQYWVIALGFSIPLILSVFIIFGVEVIALRDISPLTLAIGNMVVAWGLFRYRLFDIVPIAREHIVENMLDPVIVLDHRNRVVDLNKAASTLLGKQPGDVIGRSSGAAFSKYPIVADLLEKQAEQRKEVSAKNKGENLFFDISISPIHNRQNELVGRIVVARDITRLKNLEMNYRALSEELEQRVHERTEELRESAEQYRAVVENQTEFIVRWKPDRTRTFVNEAYCRHFGLTYEKAMQIDFMSLVAEEDRPRVEQKIARLTSGETEAETDVHRVSRPDGSVGWQEWTDHAVRDGLGKVVEFQSIGRDITERKQAEDEIRKLSRVVEQSNVSIVITDTRGRIEYVNPYFSELTGYTSEESIGQNPRILQSGFTQKGMYQELWKTIKSGKEWQGEFCNQKKNGELYWEASIISPIFDTLGKITHYVAVKTDITERKQAEFALQKSEKKHRLLFESANDGIFIMQGMTIMDCNSKTLEMFGCLLEDIIGKSPVDFSPDTQPNGRITSEMASEKINAVLTGTPQFFEWKHCRGDSTLFDAEVSLSLLELEDGTFIQAIVRDITLRKQAEEALRKSEERFSKAFRASPVIITISQISTAKLLEVNETFEKISGYTREEAIGRTTFDLDLWVNPVDRDSILSSVLMTGEIRAREIQFRVKNGAILTCLISADMIELGGEQCILATIEDISERKRAEARILRLNRLYVTISEINQTIVHARTRESLFLDICRVATDHGQFRMAWIGLIDETGENVAPVVFAGDELGYLENMNIKYKDPSRGGGTTSIALREGRCIICQDIATEPRMFSNRERALERGYLSSAAVPLREHGQVIGALTVYAGEPYGFDTEDEGLLEQIGMDVSFALDSINAESKRHQAEEDLAAAYDTTLEGWAKALELRDKETEGHSRRVTETTLTVARAMGFSDAELVHIRRGSILHDIGKMGIPDDILRKNGPLTEADREIVSKHPITAYELLKPIAYLELALEIPYSHHEKWDGSGYPHGLKGEQIPLSARIFAVVDVWDALSSDRPYRKAWSREKVADYLKSESGRHFDPKVTEVFLKMLEKGEI